MKNQHIILLVLMAATVFTVPAFAATIDLQFTTLPSDTENGTYNGFVGGLMNGVAFNNLICDDYDHTTYVLSSGQQFNVYTLSDFSQARFAGQTNALQNYENAALLIYSLENLASVDTYLPQNQQLTIGDLQYALWDIFTPGSGNTANSPAVISLLNAASPKLALPADLYASLRIYTPAGNFTSNQEFLQEQETNQTNANSSPAVPEPGTLTMAIAGLLMGGALFVKRKMLVAAG